MLDVLIKNANIIDGTGKPAYKGSIGISGGKLVMADGSEEATAVIDASGKYVSPGWIDAHSHGDLILGSEDAHLFKTTPASAACRWHRSCRRIWPPSRTCSRWERHGSQTT